MARRYILDDRLFKSVLVRERKRADRSDQPLVLMLLTLKNGTNAGNNAADREAASAVWHVALDALGAVARESDVVGWVDPNAVAGVILTEIRSVDRLLAQQLEIRVRRQLGLRFGAQTAASFSVGFQMHPEAKMPARQGLSDPEMALL